MSEKIDKEWFRKQGSIGGKKRARKLTAAQRSEIAKRAAAARGPKTPEERKAIAEIAWNTIRAKKEGAEIIGILRKTSDPEERERLTKRLLELTEQSHSVANSLNSAED